MLVIEHVTHVLCVKLLGTDSDRGEGGNLRTLGVRKRHRVVIKSGVDGWLAGRLTIQSIVFVLECKPEDIWRKKFVLLEEQRVVFNIRSCSDRLQIGFLEFLPHHSNLEDVFHLNLGASGQKAVVECFCFLFRFSFNSGCYASYVRRTELNQGICVMFEILLGPAAEACAVNCIEFIHKIILKV